MLLELAPLPPALAARLRTGRQLAQERRDATAEEPRPAAAAPLDRLLGGGLRRGALVELVGRRSSGRFSMVLAALATATGSGETAALVDLGDSLDPESAKDVGIALERLLWVRPRRLKEALASAEAILGSGIPLLILDLGLPPIAGGRGAEAAWLRLARAARAQGVALLVASPYRVSGTAATAVVEASDRRVHWCGPRGSQRLLAGLVSSAELVKDLRRRPGRREDFELHIGDLIDRKDGAPVEPPRAIPARRAVA